MLQRLIVLDVFMHKPTLTTCRLYSQYYKSQPFYVYSVALRSKIMQTVFV